MACFLVPLTQAVVTTAVRKKNNNNSIWMQKIGSLELMLWGGSIMLIVDHIINGEITYKFPYFTALNEPHGAMTILWEMLTVGVPMSAVITAMWALYVLYTSFKVR